VKGDPLEEHDRHVAFERDARDLPSELEERIDREARHGVSRHETASRLDADLALQQQAGRSVDDPWSQVQSARQSQCAGPIHTVRREVARWTEGPSQNPLVLG
jgi:hypothetical protein